MQPDDDQPRRNVQREMLAAEARRVWRVWLRLFGVVRLVVRRVLEVLLALIMLFEEWGWRPLTAGLARLGRLAPIAALERVIANLPPYGALVVFALPSALLLPLKLLALFLIAQGYKTAAALLFVGAKVAGTAIVARLYQLTEHALMRIWWFKALYDRVMPWKARLFAAIRSSWAWRYGRIVKARMKHRLAPAIAMAKAMLEKVRVALIGR